MTVLPRLLLSLALLGIVPQAESKPADVPAVKPVPAELQAAVTRAEFLGRELYLHDRAAWLATDAMRADKRMTA